MYVSSRVAILFALFTVTSPVRVFADSAVAAVLGTTCHTSMVERPVGERREEEKEKHDQEEKEEERNAVGVTQEMHVGTCCRGACQAAGRGSSTTCMYYKKTLY